MLSLNKLEKVIELEEQLRTEYQGQLDEKAARIAEHIEQESTLQATIDSQQATIEKQLETITELSAKNSDSQRAEQLNRELTNRAENLQQEISELKKRVKTLQKDLAAERSENKALKQFDPARMKKNLDSNKKKLAEKTRANDVLQKSLSQVRADNMEQQSKVKELEDKLVELQADLDTEEEAAA